MATSTTISAMVRKVGLTQVGTRPHSFSRLGCGVRVFAKRPSSSLFGSSGSKDQILLRRPSPRGAKPRVAAMGSKHLSEDVEEATKKHGLEGGLWKIMTSKQGGDDGSPRPGKGAQAKELLKQYGSAYLITSISLSLVSFGLCYFLVSAGLDVGALLAKVGIEVSTNSEKVGTVAIAYAAHKAASPIRFPPTVALTPIVANAIGKKVEKGSEEVDGQDAP